jgi:nitrite reductase/ring-hydroxylating ferredoxin subunit
MDSSEVKHLICALDELVEHGAREFSVGDGDWPLRGFVVQFDGQIYGYENSCPHLGVTLNYQPHEFFTHDGSRLQCATHGALFEPHTGRCVAGPCMGRKLRKLMIETIDGYLYLRSHPDSL